MDIPAFTKTEIQEYIVLAWAPLLLCYMERCSAMLLYEAAYSLQGWVTGVRPLYATATFVYTVHASRLVSASMSSKRYSSVCCYIQKWSMTCDQVHHNITVSKSFCHLEPNNSFKLAKQSCTILAHGPIHQMFTSQLQHSIQTRSPQEVK